MAGPPKTERADAFVRVVMSILRPLARALMAQGVTAPVFCRLVKQAYVDVAEDELAAGEEKITDSRISVLTGVHRRDVKTLRAREAEDVVEAHARATTMSTILGKWLAEEDFTDANGRPRPLPRLGAEGTTFEALVRSVNRDVRPRTILDEFLRQGIVTSLADGTVSIDQDALVGPADLDQRLHFFSKNLGDHASAAVENLLTDQPPFLERAVFYNNLSQGSVDRLEADARALGSELLLKLNRDANALQRADENDEDANHRFRFGVFFYRELEQSEADE